MPTERAPLPRGICPGCEDEEGVPIRNGKFIPHLIIVEPRDRRDPMVRLCEGSDLPMRECRLCGCTEADCTKCVLKTGVPCSWVEDDVCSACAPGQPTLHEQRMALVRDLAPQVHGDTLEELFGAYMAPEQEGEDGAFAELLGQFLSPEDVAAAQAAIARVDE